ncbi:hypothetical protein PIB30_101201, partial [Stylosanthes scabra]|nr:hypothetical protein [Stylosanthes scabra]
NPQSSTSGTNINALLMQLLKLMMEKLGPMGARLETFERALLASQGLLLQLLELTKKQHQQHDTVKTMVPTPPPVDIEPAAPQNSVENQNLNSIDGSNGTTLVNANNFQEQTSRELLSVETYLINPQLMVNETRVCNTPTHWASGVSKVSNPCSSRNKRSQSLSDVGPDTLCMSMQSQPTLLGSLNINAISGKPPKHPRVAYLQSKTHNGSWPLNLSRLT